MWRYLILLFVLFGCSDSDNILQDPASYGGKNNKTYNIQGGSSDFVKNSSVVIVINGGGGGGGGQSGSIYKTNIGGFVLGGTGGIESTKNTSYNGGVINSNTTQLGGSDSIGGSEQNTTQVKEKILCDKLPEPDVIGYIVLWYSPSSKDGLYAVSEQLLAFSNLSSTSFVIGSYVNFINTNTGKICNSLDVSNYKYLGIEFLYSVGTVVHIVSENSFLCYHENTEYERCENDLWGRPGDTAVFKLDKLNIGFKEISYIYFETTAIKILRIYLFN
jgi:hypothetical protein